MVNGDLDLMYNALVLSYNKVGLLNIQIPIVLLLSEFYLIFYVTYIVLIVDNFLLHFWILLVILSTQHWRKFTTPDRHSVKMVKWEFTLHSPHHIKNCPKGCFKIGQRGGRQSSAAQTLSTIVPLERYGIYKGEFSGNVYHCGSIFFLLSTRSNIYLSCPKVGIKFWAVCMS